MLLPPQFKEEPLKTLGPPIRKEQENKPVEVEVKPGIWRVNGKLETRLPDPTVPTPVVIEHVSEVDSPLPEFKVGDMVKTIANGPFYKIPIGTIGTIVGGSMLRTLEILFLGETAKQLYTPGVWVGNEAIVRYETR